MELVRRNKGFGALIHPKNKEDNVVFKHCAEQQMSVTEEIFRKSVAPLLALHGVEYNVEDK